MTGLGIALVVLVATGLLVLLWRSRRANSGSAALSPSEARSRVGERVTVRGRATVGTCGVQASGLAGVECVWHGHEVLRHYWASPTEGADAAASGPERARRADSIAEYAAETDFGLTAETPDDAAGMLVDPTGAEVSQVRLCLRRVVGPSQPGARVAGDDLLNRVRGQIIGVFRGETIEFEYREWAVCPGDLLEVHGQVVLRDGRAVLAAPDGQKLHIAHVVPAEARN
ncbi:hypothetical protein RIF23_08080 [Lipingzhangella sp. LS1_29]|uniref:RING-type E3 ubiquitin transferase n=1 Tax=Lipingzhangella rawalii TaxID=2055835 RepID=A0ABU2H5W9_9ACTN|nr:hypothetical protein [Lipingzhangella rawalii]